MNNNTSQAPLAERADIHKSCKSLETLLSIFNDYCEAVGAVATLQKKLVKSLRETAGQKVTGEIAGNALHATANIFEALSEIDSKFAKLADKEYDGVSNEVKKWFRKLAKEEKGHDDRIANANAKIKQAGQTYEKKSKKNARDAVEEHARYINLISSIGPEISQEKYNHTLLVSQRHTATTYSVAACVARVADAEWLRTCEGVRRYSPTIGQLGEWRALCEGGWTGPVPQDLPDVDEQEREQTNHEVAGSQRPEHDGQLSPSIARDPQPINDSAEDRVIKANQQRQYNPPPSNEQAPSSSTAPSSFEPPRPFVDSNTGSVRSLSAFPAPPTHFPLPPLSPARQSASRGPSYQASVASHTSSPKASRPFEPRSSVGNSDMMEGAEPLSESPVSATPSPEQTFKERPANLDSGKPLARDSQEIGWQRSTPLRSQTSLPAAATHTRSAESASVSGGTSATRPVARGDYLPDEFGVSSRPRVMDSPKSVGIERSDSNARYAARTHFSYGSGSASPPPKDIPRLPLSVTDLATRYQPAGEPISPRARPSSPPISRQLPLIDTSQQAREAEAAWSDPIPPKNFIRPAAPASEPAASTSSTAHDSEDQPIQRQRQYRPDDQPDSLMREREEQLRAKEREFEIRARELEQEKAQLMNARSSTSNDVRNTEYFMRDGAPSQHQQNQQFPRQQIRPRERQLSFQQQQLQRPQSQLDYASSPSTPDGLNARSPPSYPYAPSHLAPPSPSTQQRQGGSSEGHSEQDYSSNASASDVRYRSPSQTTHYSQQPSQQSSTPTSDQPTHLRPPPEKPKGWMRRLSMPIVGNAFSSDSKKNIHSTVNAGKGGLMSLDGKKNASTTMLRSGASEEGRAGGGAGGRRSYDPNGVGHRSVTNLGLRR